MIRTLNAAADKEAELLQAMEGLREGIANNGQHELAGEGLEAVVLSALVFHFAYAYPCNCSEADASEHTWLLCFHRALGQAQQQLRGLCF